MSNEIEQVATNFDVTFEPSKLSINNFDELKAKIQNYSEKYKNLVATDESLSGAKSVRAELNKLSKAIDDKRKEIKKEYNKPYDSFKVQMNELQIVLKDTINPLSEQIADIEEQQREERTQKVQGLINQMAPEYDVDPESISIEHSWTNKTMTQIKLTKILKDGFMAIKSKQDTLAANKRLIEEHCQLKNVDSAGWISQITDETDINQLISSIDKSVEDKKNAEQAKKNHEEYEEAIRKATQTKVNNKTVDQETGEIVDDDNEVIDDDAPSKWTMAFRVTDSFDKLKMLHDFIQANGISNEMIEKLREIEG